MLTVVRRRTTSTERRAHDQNSFNIVAERVSAQDKERSASLLLVVQVMRRSKEDHVGNTLRSSADMLTIAVCTHAERAERASVVSIRAVVIMILDSKRGTSTEMRYVKTLTSVVLVRLFKQWRLDASENPMRGVDVERLVFDRLHW